MPVSPNNLQFSLSSEYLDKLRASSVEGESLGLTAKRILIDVLTGDGSASEIAPSPLEKVEARLAELERQNQDLRTEIDGLRRLFYQFTSPVKKDDRL